MAYTNRKVSVCLKSYNQRYRLCSELLKVTDQTAYITIFYQITIKEPLIHSEEMPVFMNFLSSQMPPEVRG